MSKIWKVVGINFDHMHMGDLLRMVHEHANAEIAGISDESPERMEESAERFDLPPDRVFSDYRKCIRQVDPDFIILCPNTSDHADWVEKVASFNKPVLLEKPLAASLEDADRIIAAMNKSRQMIAINWPLRWFPCYITTKKLIDEGRIGDVVEIHHYGGNRGPLFHGSGKKELEPGEKKLSWWYQRDKAGGSLQDYLGYGVTIGTWFNGGKKPEEVTAVVGGNPELEVDEHSITVCRYSDGYLSKFETRWGTFTDPWTHQPVPRCGFQIVGTEGTIASFDYGESIRLQTRSNPAGEAIGVDSPEPPFQNPIQYFISCLESGRQPDGPLSLEICRIGQQIIDSAVLSARRKQTVPLLA